MKYANYALSEIVRMKGKFKIYRGIDRLEAAFLSNFNKIPDVAMSSYKRIGSQYQCHFRCTPAGMVHLLTIVSKYQALKKYSKTVPTDPSNIGIVNRLQFSDNIVGRYSEVLMLTIDNVTPSTVSTYIGLLSNAIAFLLAQYGIPHDTVPLMHDYPFNEELISKWQI